MSTNEDVRLRYAISRDVDFNIDVLSEPNGEVRLTTPDGAQVRVSARPDRPWCTCDEDAVPGTCTHVLFVAALDIPIAAQIMTALDTDLEGCSHEIAELSHALAARKQEQKALTEALGLVRS